MMVGATADYRTPSMETRTAATQQAPTVDFTRGGTAAHQGEQPLQD
jgi:hypothetical protein